jgi:hypothetical protein
VTASRVAGETHRAAHTSNAPTWLAIRVVCGWQSECGIHSILCVLTPHFSGPALTYLPMHSIHDGPLQLLVSRWHAR